MVCVTGLKAVEFDELVARAVAWRHEQLQKDVSIRRFNMGVVLVFDDAVYGWKARLCDPHHERPGALAIDTSGRIWEAVGGDCQNGAKAWAEVERL